MESKEVTYNNITYKLLKETGLGFYKKAYIAQNIDNKEYVTIFYPSVTKTYNNLSENKQTFIESIEELNSLYEIHKNKCKIIPLYTSKDIPVIITNYIEGRTFYRYLCE